MKMHQGSPGGRAGASPDRNRRPCRGLILIAALLLGCGATEETRTSRSRTGDLMALDEIAVSYVKLVLAVGGHDPDYVDAYHGPEAWKEEVGRIVWPLPAIAAEASSLIRRLEEIDPAGLEPLVGLRHEYLIKQIGSLHARVRMLRGEKFSFDEESRALYDAVAPHHDEEHFRAVLAELEQLLPGDRSLGDRYQEFQNRFVIPTERLDAVFTAAIEECRRRTLEWIELPERESYRVEYVTGKPWSGYNWFQGDAQSLVQVNVDLPIAIDRAVDLACHEGYPGHHVYNTLLEKHLARDRGWLEFSIYPLFSPQSLIAEGTANYAIQVTFPGNEREAFERDVLFPLAGLDSSEMDTYVKVQSILAKLSYAGNEAARRYLDGEIDAGEAARWLETYALMSPARAEQRVRFIDKYRSYVINYNLGQDLVAAFIERRIGENGTPGDRWREFRKLLSSPRLPSGLVD